MKFGVREICDVVLKAKSSQKIGNTVFEKDEPVLYLDTAKTSNLESATTTTYAQGGRGNSRLIAWEGEKTVTFTLEDALISPLGFAVLSGAGIIDASASKKINVHATAKVDATVNTSAIEVVLTDALGGNALADASAYGFILNGVGEIEDRLGKGEVDISTKTITFPAVGMTEGEKVVVLVDYYMEKASGVKEITVEAEDFAGSYYLEADTLFRKQSDGSDIPAQFIVPNVKVQSGFTFAMAASGDPSTFTFTMDAFPDYLKHDSSKKVLFALQLIED